MNDKKYEFKKICPTCKSKFYTDDIEAKFCSQKCIQIYKELHGLAEGRNAGMPTWMLGITRKYGIRKSMKKIF